MFNVHLDFIFYYLAVLYRYEADKHKMNACKVSKYGKNRRAELCVCGNIQPVKERSQRNHKGSSERRLTEPFCCHRAGNSLTVTLFL